MEVYNDEVLINSKELVKNIVHIAVVCKQISRTQLKLKLQKCCFGVDEAEVLVLLY